MKKLFSKLMFTAMAALTFAACDDVPEPYDIPGTGSNVPGAIEIPGGTGSGTLEDPFNAIAALNFGNKLEVGQVSKDYVYIKGTVSKLASKESDRFENNSYGNGTFYISADGSHGNEFYVYRAMYLGNKKFASGDTPVVLGDEVVICAKITNYNGTIETNQGEGFVYELNGVNRGGEILPAEELGDGYLSESFSEGFGDFTVVEISGNPWKIDYNCATATGYDNNSKTTTPGESYLVSKAVDLSKATEVALTFEYVLRFANQGTDEVLITNNYTGDPQTTTWENITGTLQESSTYSDFKKYAQNIPAAYVGQSAVVIALHYKCDDKSGTWEVRNLLLKDGKATDDPKPEPTTDTKGTKESPFTVPDAIAAATGSGVYVKGYIVGYIDGMSLEEGARFSGTSATSATNLLLAASADETTVANCMPIQLPTGAIRTALNLQDNPSNYKQEVTLYGNIETYFKVPGLKSVTYAILNGTEIGTNPDGGSDPEPSTGGTLDINFKAGQGEWVVKEATALPSGLNYVWQQTTQYGMKASAYVGGKRYATDSWLVSPAFNLTANGTLTFSQTQRYGSGNDLHVMMSTTYNGGDIDPTQWTELTVDQWPDGSSWAFITSTAPVAAGSNIRIAFRYTSSSSAAATWEIESANVK